MKTNVYKWSNKALKKNNNSTEERFIFTNKSEAIFYNKKTNVLIEPFMFKTIDSYLLSTNETPPNMLIIEKLLHHMYSDEVWMIFKRKIKEFNEDLILLFN